MHASSRQARELTSQQNAWFSLSDMKWLLSTKESLQDAVTTTICSLHMQQVAFIPQDNYRYVGWPILHDNYASWPIPQDNDMYVGWPILHDNYAGWPILHDNYAGWPIPHDNCRYASWPILHDNYASGPFYRITAGMLVGPFHTTTGMQVGPVCMTTTGMTTSDICNQQAQCTKQSSISTPRVKPGASHCWRYCYNMQVWLGHSNRTSVHSHQPFREENRPTKQATLQLSDKQCSAAGFSTCEFLERQRNPDSINLNSPTETKESHAWLVEEKQKRQGHIWGTDGHQTATLHKQVTFKGCHDNTWAKQESTGDRPAPPANERNEYKIGRKKKPSYPW